ncbi:PQQ-binding-like beta-propeller repeat protein [Phenylobacterium sp.]|jgi:polyvinyl alcohol dehydrogenase (cytochrome)|uniref:outer membrane protein assembly factor BamB family protein n=1 Tax=Phenylobacterium sp. TaxID=1871053 RepID=UPI002E37B61A|nr:PQQ-binding-like beta-propeller repeat protein [Phenylobacterium sp.]HEX2561300.1 PQQ-binding-like beta-propeller repeat protein [Phenylobacterium sp.]
MVVRWAWPAAIGAAAAALALGAAAMAQGPREGAASPHPGRAVYERACAACHDNPDTKSPPLAALQTLGADAVMASLTVGKMKEQGSMLKAPELQAVVDYLSAGAKRDEAWIARGACPAEKKAVDLSGPETWTRFGVDYAGSRNLDAKRAGLTTADLGRLEVAWSLGLPQTNSLRSAPVIVGSTLFYSASQAGYLLALDTQTGCIKWSLKTPRPMRTSMTYGQLGRGGPKALIVGDVAGQVLAVEAQSGKLLWSAEGRHDPESVLTGAPVLWRDRIIVPVSAMDVARAGNPNFPCCKVHGAVVALSARDGARLWVAHTMPDAKPTGGKNAAGADLWGPSGAPVWSSPTINERRRVIYVGTGQNTSHPATATSDAIWSIDAIKGGTRWFFQALSNDVWNMACSRGANCPAAVGSVRKDFDFGSQAIVARDARGKEIVIAGQKSGDVWGIDAEGREVWRRNLSPGSPLGGVHWGLASDGKRVFAPIADPAGAGMHALDVSTGQVLWQRLLGDPSCRALRRGEGAPADRAAFAKCRNIGMSATPLVVDGAVIAGTLDGKLMIFAAEDGREIATLDTARPFETLNGVPGKGGSIDSHSIFVGDGLLFVGSGYAQFGAPAGNVLVAYRPKRAD